MGNIFNNIYEILNNSKKNLPQKIMNMLKFAICLMVFISLELSNCEDEKSKEMSFKTTSLAGRIIRSHSNGHSLGQSRMQSLRSNKNNRGLNNFIQMTNGKQQRRRNTGYRKRQYRRNSNNVDRTRSRNKNNQSSESIETLKMTNSEKAAKAKEGAKTQKTSNIRRKELGENMSSKSRRTGMKGSIESLIKAKRARGIKAAKVKEAVAKIETGANKAKKTSKKIDQSAQKATKKTADEAAAKEEAENKIPSKEIKTESDSTKIAFV